MALELVCGVDFWCNLHCRTSPVVPEGLGAKFGRESAKNLEKSEYRVATEPLSYLLCCTSKLASGGGWAQGVGRRGLGGGWARVFDTVKYIDYHSYSIWLGAVGQGLGAAIVGWANFEVQHSSLSENRPKTWKNQNTELPLNR